MLSALCGAAGALALAPLHVLPLLAVSFSGLFWLLQHAPSWRRALLLGWLFGAAHFAVGLSWVAEAFQVDAARFGAFGPPAVALLASGLGLFSALACAVAWRLARRGGGWSLLLALTACWASAEWLRGHVLTGFPWNLVGYAWGVSDATLQSASVLGIYGLGMITVLLAALPGVAFAGSWQEAGVRRWWPLPAAAAGASMLWAWGAVQLAAVSPSGETPGVRLRIVQAGVPQRLKWDPAERDRILSLHRAFSTAPPAAPGGPAPTHVVWPEAALPWALQALPEAGWTELAASVPPGGALLAGAVRWAPDTTGRATPRNSVVVFAPGGAPVAAYDKTRLVPFGEYVPGRAVLPFALRKLTPGDADFVAGPGQAVLQAPGLPPLAPMICYESIFPGASWTGAAPPRWLLVVTNDGWFGKSWGPHQHLLAARARAIELGLPLVRAASTGISAVTDARGRVLASLPLGASGVLDAPLPAQLPDDTPYAALGDIPFAALVAMALIFSLHRPASRDEHGADQSG